MPPILLDRIDRLSGCRGQWILDLRDSEQRGYDLHYLSSGVSVAGFGTIKTPQDALAYCRANLWRSCRLLFCSDYVNDDCSWPGGYDAPSIYRSNARVFRKEYATALELADGDADGISLDVRFVTDDMLDTLDSLESYCLLDEDDHSELEIELQDEAWQSWAAAEWRSAVEATLAQHLDDDHPLDADEILDSVADIEIKLAELFYGCAKQANEYWEEQCYGGISEGYYIRIERVASAIDLADLRDLTGLPLLAADQQWRREPYPWQGAEPSPLIS